MANMNQARLEELTGIISRTVTAEQVYLFGSYAYGTPNEDSDLDLYVVIPDGSIPPAEAVKRIRRALCPVQDMPMDVVACRASTFRQRQRGPVPGADYSTKGVLLYGRARA
ncbi:MAG: nucleotidyltransferase domain-containing protein [Flavonifractor plautii]